MNNIKDVAQRAGVSVSTVSHVINGTRFVAPITKKNVEEAIEVLNYRPSSVARALKMNKSRTIGMLISSSTNPFFAEIVRGVEEGCYRHNYSLILCNSGNERERQLANIDTLIQKRIDALLVMTTNSDHQVYARIGELEKIPKVILDSEPGLDICTIGDDSVLGGEMATEFLISKGFTEIGCLTGPEDHPRSRDRLKGFRQALTKYNVEIHDNWIKVSNLNASGGYKAMCELLKENLVPKAVFAFNDLMAMGAYRAIFEKGMSIPEDISIIGYDNLEISAYLMPALTTVDQPSYKLGLNAAEVLFDKLENKTEMPSAIQLTSALVIRNSVAK